MEPIKLHERGHSTDLFSIPPLPFNFNFSFLLLVPPLGNSNVIRSTIPLRAGALLSSPFLPFHSDLAPSHPLTLKHEISRYEHSSHVISPLTTSQGHHLDIRRNAGADASWRPPPFPADELDLSINGRHFSCFLTETLHDPPALTSSIQRAQVHPYGNDWPPPRRCISPIEGILPLSTSSSERWTCSSPLPPMHRCAKRHKGPTDRRISLV